MSAGRHSYVPFYPSDWTAGTARMTPTQELVYFRICCFIWDKAQRCPAAELPLMLGAIDGWEGVVDQLIAAGKLDRTPDGSVANSRAMETAEKAFALWLKKSQGGKAAAAKMNSPAETVAKSPDKTPVTTPDKSVPAVPSQNQNQNQNHIPSEANASEGIPPKRGKRLPADWTLPDDWRAWGLENTNFDAERIKLEADKFRDYWHATPGKAGVKLDWFATWRNWLRKALTDIPKFLDRRHETKQTEAVDTEAVLERFRARDAPGNGKVLADP